eukprot:756101-Hanusia_phi.AAC.1
MIIFNASITDVMSRQWQEYAARQYYDDYARYYADYPYSDYDDYYDRMRDWYAQIAANVSSTKKLYGKDILKVAKGTPKVNYVVPGFLWCVILPLSQLVYMGDFEFGGYRKDITGGNDGGFNAPFDLNGDGQEVDNWAKVTTQWKHKKGQQRLKQARIQALTSPTAPAEPGPFSSWAADYNPLGLTSDKIPSNATGAEDTSPEDLVWKNGFGSIRRTTQTVHGSGDVNRKQWCSNETDCGCSSMTVAQGDR